MSHHLPQAAKLCLATLVAGGIYVLQNAESYADKLVDTTLPCAETMAQWLTTAADYSGLTELNIAQRAWLEKWILLGTGEEPTEEPEEEAPAEEETTTEEAPEETPAPPAIEPAPAPQPAAAPKQEPLPAPANTELPPDDDTDPLPAPGNEGPMPPQPLLDSAPITFATAEPLPWPPVAPQDGSTLDDSIRPTPPPAPLVDDISEPDSAPAPEPQPEPAPEPEPEQDNEQDSDEQTTPDKQSKDDEADDAKDAPAQAPPVRCKIMLLGDSLMMDLGPRTHKILNHRKGLQFILTAKYSTGLSRPDFFDWPEHLRVTIPEQKPDFIFVFMGGNDGQHIKQGDKFIPTGGQRWFDAYGQKMQEVIDIAKAQGSKVVWIGLPVMGHKNPKLLNEAIRAQREHCQRLGIQYVDTNETFADADGHFLAFRKDAKGKVVRLRRKDKIHISAEGNEALIKQQLAPVLEKLLVEFSASHPERCLTEEEAKKTAPLPLVRTVKFKPTEPTNTTRRKKRKRK